MLGLLLAISVAYVVIKPGGEKIVTGDWYLTFDLPTDWVTLAPYQRPNTEATVTSAEISLALNEVYLQTTDKAIVIGGIVPEAAVSIDSYVLLMPDHSQIRVSRLDPSRIIPGEAEDLGNGFFKVKLCEDNADCQIYGRHNYDYYLETDEAKYLFVSFGQDTDEMEDIILSAKIVTVTAEVSE